MENRIFTGPDSSEADKPVQNFSKKCLFVSMYETYWLMLFQMAYSRLRNREAAEEIVQEVFTTLWERNELDQIKNAEKYLKAAVRFAIIDYIRHKTTQNVFLAYHKAFLEANFFQPAAKGYADLPKLVEESLANVSVTTREVFLLNHIENWRKEKIAGHLNLTEKAIEYHLTKSRKLVEAHLRNFSY